MRKTYTQNISDVIQDYLKEMNLDNKLKEVHVVNSWEQIIGRTIAKATRNIYIKDKKLFLKIDSSVIKNELLIIKDGLIKRINEFADEELVKDIVLY